MKRNDFAKLVKKSENLDDPTFDVQKWITPLQGIALHNKRIMTTENDAMHFIRYQAQMFNGEWDLEEINRLANYFKRVDVI